MALMHEILHHQAHSAGVIGHDEEDHDTLKAIPFHRIAGGKPFDVSAPWFGEMLASIGQALVPAAAGGHH